MWTLCVVGLRQFLHTRTLAAHWQLWCWCLCAHVCGREVWVNGAGPCGGEVHLTLQAIQSASSRLVQSNNHAGKHLNTRTCRARTSRSAAARIPRSAGSPGLTGPPIRRRRPGGRYLPRPYDALTRSPRGACRGVAPASRPPRSARRDGGPVDPHRPAPSTLLQMRKHKRQVIGAARLAEPRTRPPKPSCWGC